MILYITLWWPENNESDMRKQWERGEKKREENPELRFSRPIESSPMIDDFTIEGGGRRFGVYKYYARWWMLLEGIVLFHTNYFIAPTPSTLLTASTSTARVRCYWRADKHVWDASASEPFGKLSNDIAPCGKDKETACPAQ